MCNTKHTEQQQQTNGEKGKENAKHLEERRNKCWIYIFRYSLACLSLRVRYECQSPETNVSE